MNFFNIGGRNSFEESYVKIFNGIKYEQCYFNSLNLFKAVWNFK